MPLKISDIKHSKTEANVAKYKIDLAGYDSVADVRKAIKRHQNRERKARGVKNSPTIQRNEVLENRPVKADPKYFVKQVSTAERKWASELTPKTLLNIQKYGLDVADFETKADLTKHLQRLRMKETRAKKNVADVKKNDERHTAFRDRLKELCSTQSTLNYDDDVEESD